MHIQTYKLTQSQKHTQKCTQRNTHMQKYTLRNWHKHSKTHSHTKTHTHAETHAETHSCEWEPNSCSLVFLSSASASPPPSVLPAVCLSAPSKLQPLPVSIRCHGNHGVPRWWDPETTRMRSDHSCLFEGTIVPAETSSNVVIFGRSEDLHFYLLLFIVAVTVVGEAQLQVSVVKKPNITVNNQWGSEVKH